MFGINTKIAQQQRERQIEQSQFDGIKEAKQRKANELAPETHGHA